MTTCFLRVGDDYLEDSTKCRSIEFAKGEFKAIAEEFEVDDNDK